MQTPVKEGRKDAMKHKEQATPNYSLRQARELQGWSQGYVAEQISAPGSYYVSRWECGTASPSPYYREKLCALFGKNAHELGLLQHQEVSEAFESQEPSVPIRLLPLWNIPYRRNLFFTGREDILTCLHTTLHTSKVVALTQALAISGLGGIGKTQAAVEYAYRFRTTYRAILWARAETRDVLVSDFVILAGLLNLPQKHEQEQGRLVEAVKKWLNEHSNWLLVLDNVEDLPIVEDFIPSGSSGHVILTTRAQSTGIFAQRIDLEKMTSDEGAFLLLRRAKLIAHNASLENALPADRLLAQHISELLGGLPLALDQAGAYIEEVGCSLSDYFDRYQSHHAQLLALRNMRGEVQGDHPQSVSATLSLCFEKIERAHPAAAELLNLCAFLHPDTIPEDLITQGLPDLGPVLQPVAADFFKLDAALAELRRYSLLRRNPDTKTLSVHRLVQAVLKDRMDEDTHRQWAERTVRVVNRVFPDVSQTFPDFEEVTIWLKCQQYLPHAYVCVELIQQQHMTFPEAARLLNDVGCCLRARVQYAQAEPLFQRALVIREQALGVEHPAVAQSLTSLAQLYVDTGRYDQAQSLYQRAVTIYESRGGLTHPDMAQSLNSLALVYYEQGKYEQAEPLYQRALSIYEQALGPHHPYVAVGLNHLALLYWTQGKYEQAEPLYQRALSIYEQVFGPDHPSLASIVNNLARLYHAQGKYEQAESLHYRALTIREKILGPEHPDVAHTLNGLALLYTAQGRYEQAESTFQRGLTIREQTLGSEHPYVARSLDGLALLYSAQGKYEQAEPLFQRALSIREKTLGPEHTDVANSLNNLAKLYQSLGQDSQAKPLLQRGLTICERRLGPEHPDTKSVRENYADLLRR
jgi:tetratricopeptide (TPR) repeat protein/transcriptional regulator with XRE-family HTH domain